MRIIYGSAEQYSTGAKSDVGIYNSGTELHGPVRQWPSLHDSSSETQAG